LLQRAERLAMWYIETASTIDFNDDKWEVLFLMKKDLRTNERSFIGYATLYTFHNPFLGSKLRICQVLILPPFHGRGYGRHILFDIYSIAQSRPEVTEITVEDPAEAFQNLRDLVDVEWFLLHGSQSVTSPKSLKLIPSQLYFVQNAIDFHRLSAPSSVNEVKKTLTSTADETIEQENIETKKRPYETIRESDESDEGEEKKREEERQRLMKEFRLRNKRYLLQQNGDLKGLEKSAMQRELGELYDCLEKRYQRVNRKSALWGVDSETSREVN
jgi:hypothetical protein